MYFRYSIINLISSNLFVGVDARRDGDDCGCIVGLEALVLCTVPAEAPGL